MALEQLTNIYGGYANPSPSSPPSLPDNDKNSAKQAVYDAMLAKTIRTKQMVFDTASVLKTAALPSSGDIAFSLLVEIEQDGLVMATLDVDPVLERPTIATVQAALGNDYPVTDALLEAMKAQGVWVT